MSFSSKDTLLEDDFNTSESSDPERDEDSAPKRPPVDPSFAPKILRKAGAIRHGHYFGSSEKESKVLVLYTGGTIGMRRATKGYSPGAGLLGPYLKKYPQFHDGHYAARHFRHHHGNTPLVLPSLGDGRGRVLYTFYEYDPLLDSANMTVDDWVAIATDIEKSYHAFDGFCILHGTDTMAYTASALSFMLENLGKPVIITGSQIPIFESRSDGRENFLNALILAGNYAIPEVCILFNNKLMRGNRTSKISATQLDAFDSPNLAPLATCDIQINVAWGAVYRPAEIAKFRAHAQLSANVGLLRLFPSITLATVRAFLAPPIEGVILQTYGSGNAPSSRRDILEELRRATDRGVIIVNITQCPLGGVENFYETGNALAEIGVVLGADMTPEAALAKLAYVLSKEDWSLEKRRQMVETNLRGELTVFKERRFDDLEIVRAVAATLNVSTSNELDSLRAALYPAVICALAAKGDLDTIARLATSGVNLSTPDYDLRTPLHLATSSGHEKLVEFLLSEGANVHARDRYGETALQIAIRSESSDIIALLRRAGADLRSLSREVLGDLLTAAAANGDISRLECYRLGGATLNESDTFGRTALHVAVEKERGDVVKYLLTEAGVNKTKLDIYGNTAEEVARILQLNDISQLFQVGPKRSFPLVTRYT